jgi:hypothetical protein
MRVMGGQVSPRRRQGREASQPSQRRNRRSRRSSQMTSPASDVNHRGTETQRGAQRHRIVESSHPSQFEAQRRRDIAGIADVANTKARRHKDVAHEVIAFLSHRTSQLNHGEHGGHGGIATGGGRRKGRRSLTAAIVESDCRSEHECSSRQPDPPVRCARSTAASACVVPGLPLPLFLKKGREFSRSFFKKIWGAVTGDSEVTEAGWAFRRNDPWCGEVYRHACAFDDRPSHAAMPRLRAVVARPVGVSESERARSEKSMSSVQSVSKKL